MSDNIELRQNSKIHLIGIAGSGLSAIALVLLESGFTVSGSDRTESSYVNVLKEKGARIYFGHHSENVAGVDLVVRSSAVPDDNVEVIEARKSGVPVLKRADFIGELMKDRFGIAVAGTHGKTTTTAMISWVLFQLNQDPTFIVGSKIRDIETNARAGSGPYFVIEADEYDGMFLGLKPNVAVLTNMEYDHPDCYPDPDLYRQAFLQFTRQIAADGVLIYCGDDPGAENVAREASGVKILSYGTSASCDYLAENISLNILGGNDFDVRVKTDYSELKPFKLRVSLQIPGEHNIRNALASLATAHLLNLSMKDAAIALANFQGTGRRFEILGEADGVTVIDDYAHHPTEIRATLSAARAKYPGRYLWVVWQPHTYSRTRSFLPEYLTAVRDADRLLIMEIFAAREKKPADGFSSLQIVSASQHPAAQYISGLSEASQLLLQDLAPGDVMLVLSAGDADRLSSEVLQALKDRRSKQDG
jgi:UDP-N-acetylmuramate--alanine ligase